jgi:hypothetical protein
MSSLYERLEIFQSNCSDHTEFPNEQCGKKTERKSRSRQIQFHSLHQINQARPIDRTLYLHEREVTGKETRPLLTGDVAAGAQDGGEAGVGEEGVGPGDAGPEGPEAEQRGEAEEQEPGGGEEARPQERVGAAPGVVAEEGAPASDAGRPGRGAGREELAEEGERHGGDVAGGVHGRGEGRWPGGAVGGGSWWWGGGRSCELERAKVQMEARLSQTTPQKIYGLRILKNSTLSPPRRHLMKS